MTVPPAPAAPPTRLSAFKARFKRAAILTIGTLIVIAISYGSGMRANVRRATVAEGQEKAKIGELAVARADLAERDRRIAHLEARRLLHLALLALDERNFGIAQQRLAQAVALLSAPGTPGDLAALSGQIKAVNVVAANNIGQQRTQLLDVARRFDTLVPPPNAPPPPDVQTTPSLPAGTPPGDAPL